jgi:hypothetical protein
MPGIRRLERMEAEARSAEDLARRGEKPITEAALSITDPGLRVLILALLRLIFRYTLTRVAPQPENPLDPSAATKEGEGSR